jgi:hypothetical protein
VNIIAHTVEVAAAVGSVVGVSVGPPGVLVATAVAVFPTGVFVEVPVAAPGVLVATPGVLVGTSVLVDVAGAEVLVGLAPGVLVAHEPTRLITTSSTFQPTAPTELSVASLKRMRSD